MLRTLVAACALALAVWSTAASARSANFNGAWPPEPFLSRAIASIEAGSSPWITVTQRTINDWGCARGALGCMADGALGPFVMISDEADRNWRCIILIHEEAHRLGWNGNHAGGGWAPNVCPLSAGARP